MSGRESDLAQPFGKRYLPNAKPLKIGMCGDVQFAQNVREDSQTEFVSAYFADDVSAFP